MTSRYGMLRIRDMYVRHTHYSLFISTTAGDKPPPYKLFIIHYSFKRLVAPWLLPSLAALVPPHSRGRLFWFRFVAFMHFSQQIRNQYIILLWGYCTYFWDKNVYNICVNISGVKSSISVTRILLSGENVLSSFRNPGERKWYRIFYAGHTQKRTEAS